MNEATQLHPQADKLLAYADGLLEPAQRDEVEQLLEHDRSAREFLSQMELSDLPFRSAFEPLLKAPDIDINSLRRSNNVRKPSSGGLTIMGRPFQLAAALLMGLALSLAYQHYTTVDRSNWMVQVAEYQQLYVRDTLQSTPLNPPQVEKLQVALGDALGAKLLIPDLSSYQLAFIRGQILQVNGQPLIQLVYLPAEGKPIAFCITPKQFEPSPPMADSARGLAMVHWNNQNSSFVLMGEHPDSLLMQMALSVQAQFNPAPDISS